MILSNKLKDEVNEISMSQEMKERILQNIILKEKKKKIKKYCPLKNSLELTAACCALLLCTQIVRFNPKIFKFNDNNNLVKEESINYDNNSVDNREEETQVASSADTQNSITNKLDEGKSSNKSNLANSDDSSNEDANVFHEKNFKNNTASNDGNDMEVNNNVDNNDSAENNNINNIIDNGDNANNSQNNDSTKNNNTNSVDDTSNKDNEFYDKNNDYQINSGLEEKNEYGDSDCANEFDDNVCTGSPILEFKTIEEAEKVLNFKVDLIKDINKKYEISNIIVLSGETFSIDCKDTNKEFIYRESLESGDISGDYNKYEYESTEVIGRSSVSLKGNSEKLINLALWSSNGKTHSISSYNGIEYEVVTDIISSYTK